MTYDRAVEVFKSNTNLMDYARVPSTRGMRIAQMLSKSNPVLRYYDDNNNDVVITSGDVDFLVCEYKNSLNMCGTMPTTTQATTTVDPEIPTTVDPEIPTTVDPAIPTTGLI
jgi:hypothetical protein